MTLAWVAAVVFSGAAAVCSRVAAQEQLVLPQRRGVSWDAQIEGGAGLPLHHDLPHAWFARARVGMLVMHEPWIVAFGPIGEIGGLSGLGVGGQLDLIHLATGLSIEAGSAFAAKSSNVTHVSIGYATVALEWQHHFARESADCLMFKLRIPIGVAAYLWTHR